MDHKRTFSLVALGVALSLLVYTLPVLGAQPDPAVPGPRPPVLPAHRVQFVHWTTPANTEYDTTWIDHPFSNYQPNAVLIVTHNINPGGVIAGPLNNHRIALRFLGNNWSITNLDGAAMPIGTAFNILIPSAADQVLIHVTTAENTIGNYTLLNDPFLNSHPEYLLFVTPNFSPGGGHATYDDRNLGVWYTGTGWSIFNQDGADMALNLAFNVVAVPPGPGAFVHTATPENIRSLATYVPRPPGTGRSALLFVTPNWNPPGSGGFYHDHTIGIETSGDWSIVNEDLADMVAGPAFNVLVTNNWRYLPLVVSRFAGSGETGSGEQE